MLYVYNIYICIYIYGLVTYVCFPTKSQYAVFLGGGGGEGALCVLSVAHLEPSKASTTLPTHPAPRDQAGLRVWGQVSGFGFWGVGVWGVGL